MKPRTEVGGGVYTISHYHHHSIFLRWYSLQPHKSRLTQTNPRDLLRHANGVYTVYRPEFGIKYDPGSTLMEIPNFPFNTVYDKPMLCHKQLACEKLQTDRQTDKQTQHIWPGPARG